MLWRVFSPLAYFELPPFVMLLELRKASSLGLLIGNLLIKGYLLLKSLGIPLG